MLPSSESSDDHYKIAFRSNDDDGEGGSFNSFEWDYGTVREKGIVNFNQDPQAYNNQVQNGDAPGRPVEEVRDCSDVISVSLT